MKGCRSPDIFLCHCEPSKGRRGNLMHLKERYIWAQVRILYETDKTVLIDNETRICMPKSRIYRIRLRNNTFEIYVKESTVGEYLGLYSGCSTPIVTVLTSNVWQYGK